MFIIFCSYLLVNEKANSESNGRIGIKTFSYLWLPSYGLLVFTTLNVSDLMWLQSTTFFNKHQFPLYFFLFYHCLPTKKKRKKEFWETLWLYWVTVHHDLPSAFLILWTVTSAASSIQKCTWLICSLWVWSCDVFWPMGMNLCGPSKNQ